MRPSAVVAASILALAMSGCFGTGCFVDSHRLTWDDLAVTAGLRSRAGSDANLTQQIVTPALSIDLGLLPVADGNASLPAVAFSWPAETPEMDVSELRLRQRGGNVSITGLIDAHLGKSRLAGHVDTFLAGILADPADAPALKQALLDDYKPGRNDFADSVFVEVRSPLSLDDLVASAGEWAPVSVGLWAAETRDWSFEAAVTSWTLRTAGGDLAADAAGHVQGPAVEVPGSASDEPEPDRAAIEAATTAALARLGLGPAPPEARLEAAGRICID